MNKEEQIKHVRALASELAGTLIGDWLSQTADVAHAANVADIPPACWADSPAEWLQRAENARRRELEEEFNDLRAIFKKNQRQWDDRRHKLEEELNARELRLDQRTDEVARLVNDQINQLTIAAERL